MKEQDKPSPVPLYDELPTFLIPLKGKIEQTFDGTLRESGIEIILTADKGDIVRANLFDLNNGNIKSYIPLQRGKWTSQTGDLIPSSYDYQKLDAVAKAVKTQFDLWKAIRGYKPPIREWSSTKILKMQKIADKDIISPSEFFEKVILTNLANSTDATTNKTERDRSIENKKLPRERTGRVTKITVKRKI